MSGKVNARNVLDVVKRVDGSSDVIILARGKEYPCKACYAASFLPGRRRVFLEPAFPDDKPRPEAETVEPPAAPSEPAPDQERRRPGRPRKE